MTEAKPTLLIIEDDEGLQRQLKWAFESFEVITASDCQTAIDLIRSHEPKVVTLDLGLPPDPDGTSEGFAALREIMDLAPHTKVVVASGHGERESGLKAVSMGAYDFYRKPVDAEELYLIVRRAFNLYQLEEENRRLSRVTHHSPLENLITDSEEMISVCRMVERVAPTDVSVLLLGASGTGKELLARALHDFSPRASAPFVAINCAAIPENLLESELFGYEKGAFTGAFRQTIGKIELAEGGTLFLDEVGDLPLSLQVKLLRFLQERVIERLGGRKEIHVDVRIVCATHQNLDELISAGTFREDLYYRLAEINVIIPGLAKRDGDAVLLAKHFLALFSKQHNRKLNGFSEDAIELISAYAWPGNVRELENKIKRAVILADGKRLTSRDIDLPVSEDARPLLNLKQVREEADRKAIRRVLTQSGGNISKGARLLGISRPTFYDLLRQYDIKP